MSMELEYLTEGFRAPSTRMFELSTRVEDQDMNASVWSTLPESVMFLVFSKLPLKSLIRIRILSKLWKAVDFFATKSDQGQSTAPRFALMKSGNHHPSSCEQQELWLFDTPAQEWCKFPLAPFPSPLKFRGPFAAAGGLLCYISGTNSRSTGTLELMVGNPLTQTWRLLPPNLALHELPTLAHMDSMATNTGYSITLVGLCDESGALVIEVYDSISNSWRRTDQSHAAPHLTSCYYNFFKGDEYQGLATMADSARSTSDVMTIKRIVYPAALHESSFLNRYEDKCWIQENEGSLFMCCNAPRKEGLWQRGLLESEWSFVLPLPKELKKYEKTALFLSNDVVLILGSEPHCFPPQFEDVDPHKLVMCNRVTHQWSILPTVTPSFGNVDELVKGFMFQPRFDAKP